MSTYVISDLHGQYNIFKTLLEKADFSDSDTLYMLGDAIDRGPAGIRILQQVKNSPNMHFLLGNHEFMMLNAVAPDGSVPETVEDLPGSDARLWTLKNGGDKTFNEYLNLKEEERIELVQWLSTRPLSTMVTVKDETYLLTHSFFQTEFIDIPYCRLDYRTAWVIVWMTPYRNDIFVSPGEYAAIAPCRVVLGHVPVYVANPGFSGLAPFFDGNIIDIDGGCSSHRETDNPNKGGILLRLDDMTAFTCSFAENKENEEKSNGINLLQQ